MTSDLTYYDIISTQWPQSWSPFTIRTTLCLNHLGVSYKHVATSYPDIAGKLQSLNVPPEPNSEGKPIRWTLPAVTFSSTNADSSETVMGSTEIAEHLATLSPEYAAKLFPEGEKSRAAVEQVNKAFGEIMGAGFWRHVIPFVPAILDARGAEYFYKTREPQMGSLKEHQKVVLEELEKAKGFKGVVEEAAGPLLRVYEELEGDGDGIFLGGRNEPSYPDFVVVGLVQWWRVARDADEVMKGLAAAGDGRLARVVKECEYLLRGKE